MAAGPFDLVVLSEVLYYLDDEELEVAIERAGAGVEPGGHLVAVHYRLEVPEHARSGDEVHQRLREALGDPSTSLVEEAFRLEVFDR